MVYVALGVACVVIYEPLGVSPGDVGLSYSELLARAATSLPVIVAWYVVSSLFVGALVRWSAKRSAPGAAEAGTITALVTGLCVLGAMGIILAVSVADGRASLRRGERPPSIFVLNPPWDAHVARVTWQKDAPAAARSLSGCLLYLGKDKDASVFVDSTPSGRRTLKLPNAGMVMEVLPEAHSTSDPSCRRTIGGDGRFR